MCLAVLRVSALWISITLQSARLIAALAAAGIYVIEYVFTRIRHRKYHKPGHFLTRQKVLYYGAHVSVINFALAICSSGIPTMRVQRALFILANLSATIILYVGYTFIDPWQRAWGCYPSSERSINKLEFGMCKEIYEKEHKQTPCFSDSNRGHENLACIHFSDTSGGCDNGDPDTSLPALWHVANLVLSLSFTLAMSLVRFKIREIEILEIENAK